MTDLPISGLPEATTPISTDLLAIVVDNATIPVSKKITYSNLKKVVGIVSGLDAAKSATPIIGDAYYATDTNKLYVSGTAGTWGTAFTTGDGVIISDTLAQSNDAEVTHGSTTWTKKKEIELTSIPISGTLRISFDLHIANATYHAGGKIYVNGNPVGTQQSTNSITYITYAETIPLSLRTSDLIQLYLYSEAGVASARNFRLSYTPTSKVIIIPDNIASGTPTWSNTL